MICLPDFDKIKANKMWRIGFISVINESSETGLNWTK